MCLEDDYDYEQDEYPHDIDDLYEDDDYYDDIDEEDDWWENQFEDEDCDFL